MSHPEEAKLALFAGGDLGPLDRWKTGRHVAACERCRAEVNGFSAARGEMAGLAELPAIAWNRLAAEMKANIRLGLEAGEIAGGREVRAPARIWASARAMVAYASAAALIVTGLVLERPVPLYVADRNPGGAVLQVTGNGIELREGGQALSLLHGRAQEVTYSVGAQGALRARYVEGGSVTINNVYME